MTTRKIIIALLLTIIFDICIIIEKKVKKCKNINILLFLALFLKFNLQKKAKKTLSI